MTKWQGIAIGGFVLALLCALIPDSNDDGVGNGEWLGVAALFFLWFLYLTYGRR